ncbi:MAG TPA: FAD:protein FMN transferase [Solirubrobacteraceae bacterium]
MTEAARIVPCFGGRVAVRAAGTGAQAALVLAEADLRRIHAALTLFEPDSELSRLNADPRPAVVASPIVVALAAAVERAARLSGGLVDATVGSVAAPPRAWRLVGTDLARRAVVRPAGVRIDPNGLAKGLAADIVAARLAAHDSFAVDCLGDLRVGGTAGRARPVRIADPFGGDEPVHTLRLRDGAVATSGTTRRPGHLLDPRTGEPADTGVVQATALAPTGLDAEVRAKGALLAGPDGAARHLPEGGVIVLASGAVVTIPGTRGHAVAA